MHKACIDKIEELNLMADGLLSKEKTEILLKHMSDCDACRLYYSDIIAMKKALSSMSVEIPAGLNERISEAVRKEPKKKMFKRHIYRYASVAAACLALVLVLFASGTFKGFMKSDQSMENSELLDYGEAAGERGSDSAVETENSLTMKDSAEESGAMPLPEAVAPMEDDEKVLASISENLADYRFSTSAIENPETIIVNPEGIPLDSGFGGMQDVFYASASYTVSDMASILSREFGLVEILGEDDNIFFFVNPNALPKIESRLGLVSAGKLTENKENVSVRIISVVKNEE